MRTGRFLVRTPLGARPGLGSRPRYEAPGDLQIEYVERDYHQVRQVAFSIMAQSWPQDSQLGVKKKEKQSFILFK